MDLKPLIASASILVLAILAVSDSSPTRAARGTTAIETVVPTDFETTWNVLVRELDEGDFTVNAAIKVESTIRVLLESQIPSTWVDCGTISVHSKHKVFGDRSYEFNAANSVRYMVADETVDELIDVERRTSLAALAVVQLAPRHDGTLVSVGSHYVLRFRTREFGNNISPRSLDARLDFTSADEASLTEEIRQGAEMEIVTINCRPTGELERRIVGVLGPLAG